MRTTGERLQQRHIGEIIEKLAQMEIRLADKTRECEDWREVARVLARKVTA